MKQPDIALDPDVKPGPAVMAGFYLFCVGTAFVLLSLSAYTFQLDDIKIPGLYVGGGIMLAYWAALWAMGKVAPPPRVVWIGFACYLVVTFLSALLAADFVKWIAWQYVGYNISTLGFVLLGSAVIQTRKMVELSLKFWVLMTFSTTVFGLLHYAGFLETVYKALYPSGPPPNGSRTHDLINTFKGARSMISTILNTQFFGNFLLMVLPVCVAVVMFVSQNLKRSITNHNNRIAGIPVPMIWLVVSGLSIVLALTCIFTTFSKSSIVMIPVLLLMMGCGVYFFGGVRRIPNIGVIALCGMVMALTVAFYTSGDLQRDFKNIDDSLGPRQIIWAGAWEMFRDNPVVGGGGGSFRLLFPTYRDPDYHLSRVSNVTLYAHNWVLDLLSETGFLGTVAYLVFLGGVFGLAWLAVRRCPDLATRVAVIGGVTGLVGILGGSFLTPMTRWPVGTVALHSMIGTVLGMAMFGLGRAAPARAQRSLPVAKVLLVLSLGYVVYISAWSARLFKAAFHHAEGMKRTELPEQFFGPAGKAVDPAVIDFLRVGQGHLVRALELDPARPTTYYKLAHVYNRLDDSEKSLATYVAMQTYAPDYSEVHYNLAIINYDLAYRQILRKNKAIEEGRNAEALEAQDRIHAYLIAGTKAGERAIQQSNKISVWYFVGTLYQALGIEYPQGSEESKRHHLRAAEILLRTSDFPVSRVIQEAGQVQKEEEERFRAITMAADNFQRAGEPLRAAQAMERAAQRDPSSMRLLTRAVDLYNSAGEVDEALRMIDDRLRQNPFSPDMYVLKMELLHGAGRIREAIEEGKFALLLNEEVAREGKGFLAPALAEKIRENIVHLNNRMQTP